MVQGVFTCLFISMTMRNQIMATATTWQDPNSRPGYRLIIVKYVRRKNGTIQYPPPGKKGIPIWVRD